MSSEPSLSLVVLRCLDLARSREFYETLGLTFAEEQHGSGPRHLAAVMAGGTVLELYPAPVAVSPERGAGGDVRLRIATDRFDALAAHLTAEGQTTKRYSQPDGTPVLVLTDPDARQIELTPEPAA